MISPIDSLPFGQLRFRPLLQTLREQTIADRSTQRNLDWFFTTSFQSLSKTIVLLARLGWVPKNLTWEAPRIFQRSFVPVSPAVIDEEMGWRTAEVAWGTFPSPHRVEILSSHPKEAVEVGIRIFLHPS